MTTTADTGTKGPAMTEAEERAAFEAWYDAQPEGRINPFDVWQARAALSAPAVPDGLFDAAITPCPLRYPLSDYHRAMSEGPLNYEWQDKPHRLVYDLIAALMYYAAPQPQEPQT